MGEIKLTPRLNKVADMVTGQTLADIGTDHGKLPVYLLLNDRIKKAIACDINKSPLDACRKTSIKNNAEAFLELRLGDGLSPLKHGDAETIVIAGMGGELIVKILQEGEKIAKSAKEIILQPMTSVPELREYLRTSGYKTICEALACEEGKLYSIIKVCKGESEKGNSFTDLIPPYLIDNKDPYLPELIEREVRRLTKQIEGLMHATKPDEEKIKEYKILLEKVRGAI